MAPAPLRPLRAGLLAAALAAAAVSGCGGASAHAPTRPPTAGSDAAAPGGGASTPESTVAPLPGGSAALIGDVERHSPAGHRFAVAHGARIVPDAATGSFSIRSTHPAHPAALIVVVHGHNTNAFSEWKAWQPYAAAHGYGLAVVEWQLRFGAATDFLDTPSLYGLLARVVADAGVAPGRVLLHGFSQGAHEVFDLTSLDRARAHLIGLTLAESGFTRADAPDPALAGSRWVLYCAGHDQFAELTGCTRMRQAAAFLTSSRARVDTELVNPGGHHGSLLFDPPAVQAALADFARVLAGH